MGEIEEIWGRRMLKLNNFDNIDNSLLIVIKHLEEYKKYHKNVLSDYEHYLNK